MQSHMCMAQNRAVFRVLHLSVKINKNLKLLGINLVASLTEISLVLRDVPQINVFNTPYVIQKYLNELPIFVRALFYFPHFYI